MEVHNVTADAEEFTSNAYLVVGDRTALVDVGSMEGVVDVIRQHADDVEDVVLTHQHGDHVGQLDAVLDAFDADLHCYDNHPRRTRPIADGDRLKLGDEQFRALYTPGHADDHLVFVSDETLFSGDVVVHDDGAFDYGSFGRTDMAGQSREELIESIEKILARMSEDVHRMYSGHGGTFEGDVRDVVETALERAKLREPKYPE